MGTPKKYCSFGHMVTKLFYRINENGKKVRKPYERTGRQVYYCPECKSHTTNAYSKEIIEKMKVWYK